MDRCLLGLAGLYGLHLAIFRYFFAVSRPFQPIPPKLSLLNLSQKQKKYLHIQFDCNGNLFCPLINSHSVISDKSNSVSWFVYKSKNSIDFLN